MTPWAPFGQGPNAICDSVCTRPIDNSKLAIEYCRFRLPRGIVYISRFITLASPRFPSRWELKDRNEAPRNSNAMINPPVTILTLQTSFT